MYETMITKLKDSNFDLNQNLDAININLGDFKQSILQIFITAESQLRTVLAETLNQIDWFVINEDN